MLDLDVKIIPVFMQDTKRVGCIESPIGSAEFLALFRNAKFVCTDSFHGMIFSIIFHVNFIEFKRFKEDDPRNQNFRIYNLADLLCLHERITDGEISDDVIRSAIDFDAVDRRLKVLREESLCWLKNALDVSAVKERRVFRNHVLQDHELCCGCGACGAVCPVNAVKVSLNHEGFYEACIDESLCIQCGKCKSVCPLEKCEGVKCSDGSLFSYKDNDKRVLLESSSGGFAYRLGVIANNNGWNVCGCEFDRTEGRAKHIMIEWNNPEEICRLQGSKYMQSSFADMMKLIDGRKVLVFGTPCYISGVKRIAGENLNNFILVDLICHGVPSEWLYRKYLEYLKESKGLEPEGLNTLFRYKHSPGQWREIYIYNEDFGGKGFAEHQSRDPYFLMFEHMLCYSRLCYECPYRDKSNADIRIGDYWGKRFADDKTGVSMVDVMTEKGRRFLEECGMESYGEFVPQPMGDYTGCQQMRNFHRPVFYEELIEKLTSPESSLPDIVREYITTDLRRYNKMKQRVKGIIKKIIRVKENK